MSIYHLGSEFEERFGNMTRADVIRTFTIFKPKEELEETTCIFDNCNNKAYGDLVFCSDCNAMFDDAAQRIAETLAEKVFIETIEQALCKFVMNKDETIAYSARLKNSTKYDLVLSDSEESI